jgi:predicted permease
MLNINTLGSLIPLVYNSGIPISLLRFFLNIFFLLISFFYWYTGSKVDKRIINNKLAKKNTGSNTGIYRNILEYDTSNNF